MNRTILIVICDFLLVSLLAFSTVDINKVAAPSNSALKMDLNTPAATNRVGGRQDLGDVMRLALEEERAQHNALAAELSKTRLTATEQQALLHQREAQLQTFQQQLRSSAEAAARLQEQQTNLSHQLTTAQTNIENLNQQLHATTVETLIGKEERAAQEAEMRRQLEKAAALQAQLAVLENSNRLVTTQREQLAGQLQLTEAEKRAAAAQLAQAQQDLNSQREQNAKLSEGVKVLAGKSSELAQEIRENRPLAPNTIFNELATNRVTLNFNGARPGFFGGESTKDKQTETVLVSDGPNIYAVCHVQDTLLSFWNPAVAWDALNGSVTRGGSSFTIPSLSFYLFDPRVVFMPMTADMAKALGCKIYRIAGDPYKFQDAVVVGARQGYYGQCQFQIDLSTPLYLKMDRNSLKGIFGKFNPSTGDLVFSKTGELLGVMANNTYCIGVKNFQATATFTFGPNTSGQPIADTLASLYSTVNGLPFKLQ